MDTHYYELHVTVLPQQILEFAAFCTKLNAKPLYIQLDRGIHKNQPMLAVTTMLPDDMSAKAWAIDYGELVAEHFPVSRVKLESRLIEGPNEYYEAHWKLNFPHGDSECQLAAFVEGKPHMLRSYNLFDSRIQYLSQRIYGLSDPLVGSDVFNASGAVINLSGLPLVKTHYERCVWDSNPALDYGWG
jgi:hypothetical protein